MELPHPSPEELPARRELIPPRKRFTRGRIAFGVLLGFASFLMLYVVWPFRVPLLLAAILGTVCQGFYGWTIRRLHGRRVLSALLVTLALLLVIIGPLAAVIAFAAREIVAGLGFVRTELGARSMAELTQGHLPAHGQATLDALLRRLHVSPQQLHDVLGRAAAGAERSIQVIVTASSRAVFHTAIMLLAFYFFLLEGRRIVSWVWRVSPLEVSHTEDLLAEFRRVSRAAILGSATTALFQGIVAGVGYRVTGVPHAVFFGLLTVMASLIPIVGTLLVWLPAVAFLWLFDHHVAAVVLLVWCVVLVVGLEHVGKPFVLRFILRGGAEMHTGLLFLALLGGIQMFGLIGIVLGPLIVAFFIALLRMYERDFAQPSEVRH